MLEIGMVIHAGHLLTKHKVYAGVNLNLSLLRELQSLTYFGLKLFYQKSIRTPFKIMQENTKQDKHAIQDRRPVCGYNTLIKEKK